ncbi:MAG: NAD-dependent epimerase/dehydratase family protein [Ruminococcaceae bacterium]|nr:NAD-dependent epimerase/dehydratase family protein [Oscillospiraceae bacterium]
MSKKILILGATGAMATYLIPELLGKGYKVDGVTIEEVVSDNENLTYITHDAKDMAFLKEILKNGYDAVVDFMIYNVLEDFKPYYNLFSENTEHYLFFSTYRVYAGEYPITENSKRLWDELPEGYITEREYSIYKAQEEDYIRASGRKNYTIVRPAITYSTRRLQLTTLEANTFVYRMLTGKTVVLPESAMDKQATMTWAGDVAKMLSAIILNPDAYGETYTVSTAEHMTWREVVKIFEEVGGLKYITVDDDTYVSLVASEAWAPYARQQLTHDRCLNRVVDNSKILALMGVKQEDLMPLYEGIKKEFSQMTVEKIGCNEAINQRMDEYLAALSSR